MCRNMGESNFRDYFKRAALFRGGKDIRPQKMVEIICFSE